MTDDKKTTFNKDVIGRLNRVKSRLQQAFPEIGQLIEKSELIETAKKVIDPKNIDRISDGLKKLADSKLPRAIIKQAVIDFQLRELFAKTEALVSKANRTLGKMVLKETLPTDAPANETCANEAPLKKARVIRTRSTETSVKKTVPKKTPSKRKK
jgi:hypothetical protein